MREMHRRFILAVMESRAADVFVNEKFSHIDGEVNKIVDSKLLIVFKKLDESTKSIESVEDKMTQLDKATTTTLDKFDQANQASKRALLSRMKTLEDELPK